MKAISAFSLTMPRYKQFLAAMQNLQRMVESDSRVVDAMEGSGDLSIDQVVAHCNGCPVVKGSITKAGLTTRDFALMQGALLQAGLAYGIMQQYKIPVDSVVKTTGVSRANLDSYAKNEAELTRLNKEREAMSSRAEEAAEGGDVDKADNANGE